MPITSFLAVERNGQGAGFTASNKQYVQPLFLNMIKKKVLLTGSHGFIGNHLYRRISEPLEVSLLYRSMLYSPSTLTKYIEHIKPDYIFHLAAYGNHSFQTEQEQVIRANITALMNLLEASKNLKNLKAFMNFSTTHHNLEAGSFYGSTKASGEYLARAYVRNLGMPIVNIRPYSIYGEREWDFRFIPTISRQIAAGEPITVSDVDHDWTYVEDFIDGLLEATSKSDTLIGKSVGIGSGTRRSNIDIANILIKSVGKKVKINKGNLRSYEIAAYGKEMMSSKDKDETFFKVNKTPLEDGLKRVYDNPELWLSRNSIIEL